MDKSSHPFLDFSILSLRNPKEDQNKLLQKISVFFSRIINIQERFYQDEAGHAHCYLEVNNKNDLTTFIQLWTSLFEFLLKTLPKYLKGVQPATVAQRSYSPFVVLKLGTNSEALSHLFLNLTNVVLPLIKISMFFEEVLDGIVIIVKEEKDFKNFLEDPLDEPVAKQFYKTLGIEDENFFNERKQFFMSNVQGFLIKEKRD